MKTRLSKSQILKYLNCPYQWFIDYRMEYEIKNNTIMVGDHQFLRHYELPDGEGVGLRHLEPEPPEGSPLKIGLELHEIYEKFYGMKEAKEVKKPYEKNVFDILMGMENAWKYEDQIKNFAKFNAGLINDKGVENYAPISVEQSIFNEKLNFIGIIDRVDVSNDGEYSILDYKTGKSHRIDRYMLELSLYCILYEKEYGVEVDRAGILFSKTKTKPKMADITRKDKREALGVLQQVRKNIKESTKCNNDFRKQHTYLCRFCSNADICKTMS